MLKFSTPERLWFIRFTKKILSKNIKNPKCGSLPKFLQPTLGFVEFKGLRCQPWKKCGLSYILGDSN
jgi:putative component of membrane protein insertase Oxa1/YidC/SpoIIIJ protein YidD